MTFWRLYYHLTWATRERMPLITPEVEPRLFAYLVRKAAELGVYVYAINGWSDHIHLVVAVPPKLSLAEVVKNLKGASSHDLNHEAGFNGAFAWQRGYGALSVGEKQRPFVEAYVHRQKTHHAQRTTHARLECSAVTEDGPETSGIQFDSLPPVHRE